MIACIAIAAGLLSTTAFITRLLAPDGEITEVGYIYALRAAVVIGGLALLWAAARAPLALLQKASLLMATLVVTFTGIEIALRAFERVSGATIRSVTSASGIRESAYPGLIWENTPGYAIDDVLIFNSRGLRDDERAYEAGRATIAVVGDSIESDVNFAAGELYPRRLEAMLNADSRRTPTQVLDFGVYGYGLHQKVLALKYRALEWAPRRVIVGYCLNDPIPSSEFEAYFTHRPKPLVELRTLTLVNDRVRLAMHGLGQDFHASIHDPGSESWAGVVNDLRELGALSRQHQFDVTLVIFPLLFDTSVSYPWTDIHRRVTEAATASGLRVVDLLKSFQDAGIPGVRFDTVHPNARGHEIAAQRLFEALTAAADPLPR